MAVSELADSSVNFVVRPWVLSSDFHAVKFQLIEQIKLGFDARGLTIPFPSRDVFVHHSMDQKHYRLSTMRPRLRRKRASPNFREPKRFQTPHLYKPNKPKVRDFNLWIVDFSVYVGDPRFINN